MTRRYWPMILTLAFLWGASYLLIKVGVDGGLSPASLMSARALIAGIVLMGYLTATMGFSRAVAEIRTAWFACIVLGVLNAAVPFWLVAWGETHIDSGIASIAQATVPLFSLLIGLRFLPHERVGTTRIVGIGVGLVGAVLVAGMASGDKATATIGVLAVVLASFFYASGAIFSELRLRGTTSGSVLATGSLLAAGCMLLPFGIAQHPVEMPTAGAAGSLLLLAVFGTALANLILFHVIALHGARRLSLVTYLMPGIALVYGAILLGERISAAELTGLALILLGVALGSGTLRLRTGKPAAQAP
ncbi:MAG: DMT family transporter [Thermoleophilia bacterium]